MATHPQKWEDVLTCPAYVINMDRQVDRLRNTLDRLEKAGFTNVIRWQAVDPRTHDVAAEWAKHGSPPFDPQDGKFLDMIEHPYKQCIMLSHLALCKHIIETKTPWAVIFEDDVAFHKHWKELAPQYFDVTPKDYGLCYIGHHCGCGVDAYVLQAPVYCTHAFIITLEGATCIYNKMINEPNGVRTIDCLLNHYMIMSLVNPDDPQHKFCKWYAWNAEMFPDNSVTKHPDHVHKDVGLVFQEYGC